jgi:hypothetical protein
MTGVQQHPYQYALEFCDQLCDKNQIQIYYREVFNMFDVMFVVDEDRIQFLKDKLSLIFPSHVNLVFISTKQVLSINRAIRSRNEKKEKVYL